jgi:acetoin utilization deacetylase AcuC-like enzyme
MTTALVSHPACLTHDTGPGHPERKERLAAILALLDDPLFSALLRIEAGSASRAQLTRVHDKAYVEQALAAIPTTGWAELDGDTIVSPGSGEAALRASGALVTAVALVARGEVKNAFCAVRPPGHHAERDIAMGFCIFNNFAVGAAEARAAHGLKRVAIVDFDVHHGNGTQHIFADDPDTFYASTHQMPLYPGTGGASERGVGNIRNAPLPPYAGSAEFREAMEEIVLPALAGFGPDLILVSAGFDAHRADPLASLELETEDFSWVTEQLCDLADEHCAGRLVSTLEGGYALSALAESVGAHVQVLMSRS